MIYWLYFGIADTDNDHVYQNDHYQCRQLSCVLKWLVPVSTSLRLTTSKNEKVDSLMSLSKFRGKKRLVYECENVKFGAISLKFDIL